MCYREPCKGPCSVVKASTFTPVQIGSVPFQDDHDQLDGHENSVSAVSGIEVDQGIDTYCKDSPFDHQRKKSPDSDSKPSTLAAEEAAVESQNRTLVTQMATV